MTAFNSTRQPMQNTSSVLKSKSYLNAMTDLQTKVKQLEQENDNLKNTIRFLKEDRNRSMSESNCMTEELKTKIHSLEPKAKKLE
jgi:flagellar capping protein FliD